MPQPPTLQSSLVLRFGRRAVAVRLSDRPAALRLVEEFGASAVAEPPAGALEISEASLVEQHDAGAGVSLAHLFLLKVAGALEDDVAFLHGAAVERDGRALAFVGPSGSGK